MKAAVCYKPHDLRLEEREKPSIKNVDDVLIKVKRVGICGSDIHILHGSNPFVQFPRVLGHEIVGIVEGIGSNVKNIKVNDHVVIEPIRYCGKCYACRNNMPNACGELQVTGVHHDGGMQEYIVFPQKQVHVIDKNVSFDDAVLVEPYTIAGNATLRGDVKAGDTVVVQGAGPIGITILRMAKVKGASVLITDLVDEKLQFAKKNGADVVVNPSKENVIEKISEWTKGEMANVIIDAVGTPRTFESCLDMASAGGKIVVLGMDSRPSNIPQLPLMKKQLTILGSRHQSYQFVPVIKLVEEGKLCNDGLITHHFNFNDINKAFELIDNSPELVKKVVLDFD